VLRIISGVAEGWRILHNKELHYLYASPNIITVIKSRRMGWAGHVASIGEMRNAYTILVENPKGKRTLEDLAAEGKIVFESRVWTDASNRE
jgi:hypothetical protein